MSFERTGLALQNPDIQRALTAALAVLPRDEALVALPRASRQVICSHAVRCYAVKRCVQCFLSSVRVFLFVGGYTFYQPVTCGRAEPNQCTIEHRCHVPPERKGLTLGFRRWDPEKAGRSSVNHTQIYITRYMFSIFGYQESSSTRFAV